MLTLKEAHKQGRQLWGYREFFGVYGLNGILRCFVTKVKMYLDKTR